MNTSAYKIVKSEKADAVEIANLLRRSITLLCELDHQNDPDKIRKWLANKTAAHVSEWIDSPAIFLNAIHIVNDRRVISGVCMGDRSGQVLLNYILPEFRNVGVSKSMMSSLESKFESYGISTSRLSSTKTAEKFYRGIGYLSNLDKGTKELNFYKELS